MHCLQMKTLIGRYEMKRELTTREKLLKQINMNLNELDKMIENGVVTRKELTDIVLRRHILAMKQVLRYADKNLNI